MYKFSNESAYFLYRLIAVIAISASFVSNVQGQKSLAEIYSEGFAQGSQQAHETILQSREHTQQAFLQYNNHLQEIRILEMELREERRKSTLQSALAGFPGSQYLIGMLLLEEGGAANETDAVRWLHLSGEQGFADAQTALGHIYQLGIGVPSDPTKSVKWFQLATNQNHSEAMYHLGIAYRFGQGVMSDSIQSFELIHNAAENGYAQAQHYMGITYLQGIGTEIDEEKGFEWIQKAPPEICQIFETCIFLGLVYALGELSSEGFCDSKEGLCVVIPTLKQEARHGVLRNVRIPHLISYNFNNAMLYFSLSSSQEDVHQSMIFLGEEFAHNAQQDIGKITAYMWFHIANELGHSTGEQKADSLYDSVPKRKTRHLIKKRAIGFAEAILNDTYRKVE